MLLACLLATTGCSRFGSPAPTPPHYVLGANYQVGGIWFYPQALTQYEATGLLAIVADHRGLTADGETYDPAALAGSHPTLQLPVIARVTNLENGRQVLVRLNDRGPADPARVVALTPHAAALLRASAGTRVSVQLDGDMTRQLTDQVGGGPALIVATAPRASVQAEPLAPPPGIATSNRANRVQRPAIPDIAATAALRVPDRLPDQVTEVAATPGQIYLRASQFGRIDYAQRQAAQLTGLNPYVEPVGSGRTGTYRVRAGPFATVAEADAAMAQARRAGVIDSRLVVE